MAAPRIDEPVCRDGCGACCVAISISSPMPGLPAGKPAGMSCPHLTEDMRCAIYNSSLRPPCCGGLRPMPEMCGVNREGAMAYLDKLENETKPG